VLPTVSQLAVGGKLRNTKFRSLAWSVLLGVLPSCPSQWPESLKNMRDQYSKMKKQFSVKIEEADYLDPSINNPLSQAEDSPWHQHFLDSELKKVIWQDVVRTFPGVAFFQDQSVRETMVNLLFIYARAHPNIGYRQGMHELLGPIYFVIVSDHRSFASHASLRLNGESEGDPTLADLFREGGQEADTYHIFQKLLEAVGPWYVSEKSGFMHGNFYDDKPWSRPQDLRCGNKVVESLNYIHDVLLKRHDPTLYNRLEKLEIFPQIYGIRWLRLLFGREFVLSDTLVLWDAILGLDRRLSLVDQLVVSLLASVRDLLLKYDYPDAVQLLMKLPSNLSVDHVISVALHLQDPLRYPKPTGSAFTSSPQQKLSLSNGKVDFTSKPEIKGKKISAPKLLGVKSNNIKVDRNPMKLIKLKPSINVKDPKDLPEFTVVDIKNEEFEKIEDVPDDILKSNSKIYKESVNLTSELRLKMLKKIDILNSKLVEEDLKNQNEILTTVKELKSLCATLPNSQMKELHGGPRLKRNVSVAVDVETYFKEK
jgi:hypothetical protein